MAIELSARAKSLLNQRIIETNMILDIEGWPLLGINNVFKTARFGEDGIKFGQPGLKFGGAVQDKSARAFIDLSESTNNVTQQLFQDKGVAGSVTSMAISIVDKSAEITRLISPGAVLPESLSRKAILYSNFVGGRHPEDSSPILFGVVSEFDAGLGSIKIKVQHPDGLKRQEIFPKIQTALVEEYRYRAKSILGVRYQTQDRVAGLVTLNIIGGGTKGSETITVASNALTIRGVIGSDPATASTASDIVSAIKKSQAAVNLVDVETLDGMDELPQSIAMGGITLDSSTTLKLESVDGLLTPSTDGTFKTYVRIEDEIIQYTGITGTTLTGITPGRYQTVPRSYEVDTEVASQYQLIGPMKDIALKMMLSKGAELKLTPLAIERVNQATFIENGFFFKDKNLIQKTGISVGDLVTCVDPDGPNSFENKPILSVGSIAGGSYIMVDGFDLVTAPQTAASITVKSKYDVWPDGLAMQIDQVDIARHEELSAYFPTGFFDYDFLLSDTITGDKFLETEVYRPSGGYSIPRDGRSSMGITLPPLAQIDTKTLDETNILNISSLRIVRGFNDAFYNSVVFAYDPDAIEEEFTKRVVKLSGDSISRIKNVKNIPYKIEAKGIRSSNESNTTIDAQVKRIFDRYQYGAERIPTVEILYKIGYGIEVGSTVIFGSEKLMMTDSTNGSRRFQPRVMEVVNKKTDFRNGKVTLELLNTAYTVDSKYGVISPASLVGPGATTSHLPLKKSFSTPAVQNERYKWVAYVGQTIMVRSEDWTSKYETVFRGFDGNALDTMVVNPPLPEVPGEDWIVEAPEYPASTDPAVNRLWKTIHCYFTPRVKVVSSSAPNKITVAPEDIVKFRVLSPLCIHNEDYSHMTNDRETFVQSIEGNEITLSADLNFTVTDQFMIDSIGFVDGGAPYRLL